MLRKDVVDVTFILFFIGCVSFSSNSVSLLSCLTLDMSIPFFSANQMQYQQIRCTDLIEVKNYFFLIF